MKTKCSKRSAVEFIRSTVRNGAVRTVELIASRMVMVTLSKRSAYDWAQVVIVFRKAVASHRWAITIGVLRGSINTPLRPTSERGLENARFAMGTWLTY